MDSNEIAANCTFSCFIFHPKIMRKVAVVLEVVVYDPVQVDLTNLLAWVAPLRVGILRWISRPFSCKLFSCSSVFELPKIIGVAQRSCWMCMFESIGKMSMFLS